MAINRRMSLLVLLLVLNYLPLPTTTTVILQPGFEFKRLELWEDFLRELANCEQFPDSPECEDLYQKKSIHCTYAVNLRSKFYPTEEVSLCGRPRQSLPCQMHGGSECQLPPMEISEYDLLTLYVINQELQARILRLQSQQDTGLDLSLDIQREVEQIIADNVAWLCSRKCNNSSCEFIADLQPQRKGVGSITRMTSLVTEYPFFPGTRHIEIFLPIGSYEISRLLKKATPFRHLAVSSLPLAVSCHKN
nr:hypothetical protein HmN_000149100 [Hymenolepis microstoma]